MPDKQYRILHVTFNMGIGGTEQVIRQLVEATSRLEIVSEIVCIDGNVGPIGDALKKSGVQVHCVNRATGLDWALITKIRSLIKGGAFDIVHCHQYTPYFYGWLAALGTRAKVVFTEHGRFHPDRHRYKAFLFNAVASRMTSRLVSISKATKDALVEYEFMPRSRIQVVYNGIRPLVRDEKATRELRASLGIPEGDFVVGTVARLDPVKNQTMMLDAFKTFRQQYPDAWLLMVGDGPDRAMLEQRARDIKVDDRTVFTGFVNEPANHLSLMDVFLLSSHTEGTSMTLLEAMSLGIPSIVTRVGGNPEIVQHMANGLLVPPDDANAFSVAISKLRADPGLREQMKNEAFRIFAARFSAQAMAQQYIDLYKHSLGSVAVKESGAC